MNLPYSFTDALTAFLEADTVVTRDRYVARRSRPLQRAVAAAFRKQGQLFTQAFGQFKKRIDADAARMAKEAGNGRLREALSSSDWLPLWQSTAAATSAAFSADLETAILEALIFGGGELLTSLQADELDLGISWNLQNPRAVAYARMHAAVQVARIDDTTQTYLNSLISQALEEGWSYDRLSAAIGAKFVEFATGGDNPRSRRVAVYELGDAYEAGNEMAARALIAAGLEIEKKWSTVGDDKVRPTHRENQAAGWIAFDDTYPSGDSRPPTDSGCRCATLYRRKKA